MRRIVNDVAEKWQWSFQEPATKWFEGIIDLYSYIMVYIVILLIGVTWILASVVIQNKVWKNKFAYKYNEEGRQIEFIWTVIPAIILIMIAIPSFKLLYWMDEVIDPVITIKVIGKQWYWECEYGDIVGYSSYMVPTEELEEGQLRLLEVDNKIVVPINKKIRVIVSSGDVIHSWAIPSLGIKTDAIPGRLNQTSMTINREGTYYGQCSELCGVGHAFMVRFLTSTYYKVVRVLLPLVVYGTVEFLSWERKSQSEHSMELKEESGIMKIVEYFETSVIRLRLDCLNIRNIDSIAWERCMLQNRHLGDLCVKAWRTHEQLLAFGIVKNYLKISNDESKSHEKVSRGNKGLPKVRKDYGNRDFIVPIKKGRGSDILWQRRNHSDFSPMRMEDELVKLEKVSINNPKGKLNNKLYKLMCNKELLYIAYNNIKSKPANMTSANNESTLEGLGEELVNTIISQLLDESFQFSKARNIDILKPKEGVKIQTMVSSRDKIVQEMMRIILQIIFVPTFEENSHEVRNNRGSHSALKMVEEKFKYSRWVIEGNISKCIGIENEELMKIIGKRITDVKFMNLIRKALRVDYIAKDRVISQKYENIIGTPKGSIVRQILSNIMLNELDKYILSTKLKFDVGERAERNKEYQRVENRLSDKKTIEARELRARYTKIPSLVQSDNYRTLNYVRYGEEWIVGIRGSWKETEQIRKGIEKYIREELKLEERTKITDIKRGEVKFLGAIIKQIEGGTTKKKVGNKVEVKRIGVRLNFSAPMEDIKAELSKAGFLLGDQPVPKTKLQLKDKDHIISVYNTVFRGYLNYYSFASNRGRLISYLYYVLWFSCGRLLASKYKLKKISKVIDRFGKDFRGEGKIGFNIPTDYKVIKGVNKWKVGN